MLRREYTYFVVYFCVGVFLRLADGLLSTDNKSPPKSRRQVLLETTEAVTFVSFWWFVGTPSISSSSAAVSATSTSTFSAPFVYSSDWRGTALPVLSLEEAVATNDGNFDHVKSWPMARWPDPILRRPASNVDSQYFGTEVLQKACKFLANTAINEKAVGLAAEQCGIDARIIYLGTTIDNAHPMSFLSKLSPNLLRTSSTSITMVNPRIVDRSAETLMKVWRERCLVLPSTFTATVLRDAWIDVEYQDVSTGDWKRIHLEGEPARAFQHEFDHDRGILITDHIDFDDMENDMMALIEKNGHEARMALAFSRLVEKSQM